MRILVVGDFGGARPSARPQRFLRVDPDAPALDRLGASVDATAGGRRAAWPVRGAGDFAPDTFVDRWEDAGRILDARTRLAEGDPSAAGDVERLLDPAPDAASPQAGTGGGAGGSSGPSAADLLASVIAETPAAPDEDAQIANLIRGATESSLRRIRDSTGPERRKGLLAAADAHLAAIVRAVLAAPRVRALEAAWRGLDLLARSIISVEGASLHVADLSREELDADVGVSGPLSGELFRHLADRPDDRRRADLVVVAFAFDAAPRDVATLLRLARLAEAGGFTLLADAAPALASGAPQGPAAELWRAFRRMPEARRVGLVHPRVLLRGPWGKAHRRTERFAFEEFEGRIDPARLSWGPGAFAAASILATAFEAQDGAFACVGEPELSGLAAVTAEDDDGDMVLLPCAERRLGGREVQAASAAGVIPLVASSDEAAVRLVHLPSCADPPAQLAAPG
jgi:predicted component of type VI protein secretion system